MPDRYDLAVIGAGSAGLTAVSFARRLGARVALVEQDRLGGDCTWTGCVPSKTLLHAAKVAHQMRHADAVGLQTVDPKVDLDRVMTSVRAAIERVYAFETPDVLAREGVEVVLGRARFRGPHALEVDGRILHSKRFVICTGSQPALPPIPGLSDVLRLTYNNVFELKELPGRLLVLGGGPIGVELSQAFQRLGSQVTIIQRGDRILSVADPEASAVLAGVLRREGVKLCTRAEAERVEEVRSGVRVTTSRGAFEGDKLLTALGRQPKVEGLGLERAGVEFSEKGIAVDDRLRTSRSHIYAAGDVTGSFQFTHYAGWQGFIAARNALLPGASGGKRDTVPWVIFSDPQVGQVGLTEGEARERGEQVRVHRWPVERIDRAQTVGEQEGFIKLVTRPNGTLLGATVVAGAGDELTNELALAMQQGLKLGDLGKSMHVYPTYGMAAQQASYDATVSRLTSGWRGSALRALVRWLP
ncbi:MAG TPA: FAD-dependent oxidoreductase [Herpetosiphonaceae bacterium]|nr:FAD-dependent oxidoreductase [Herpetosiphonaceae bacterium]